MASGCTFQPLADLLREVERRLGDDAGGLSLSLVVMDRVDVAGATSDALAHRGIAVLPTSSRNTGEYRDVALARVEDQFSVALLYRIRPKDQRASRDEALTLEEQIRMRLTDSIWMRGARIVYLGTPTRGPHPKSAEWYLIAQTFTAQRDALLGG